MPPARRPSRPGFFHLWWMHPFAPIILVLLGTAVSAYVIPYDDYVVNWKAPKCFDADSLKFVIWCVAGFVVSGLVVHLAGRWFHAAPEEKVMTSAGIPWPVLWFLFYACFVLSTLAYVIWLAVSVAHGLNPTDILDALHNVPGAVYAIRDKSETVPGVTTFTQLEMALGLLGTLLGFRFGWRRNFLRLVVPMGFVFLLAALRAHFREERVALIEIAIPVVVLAFALARTTVWPLAVRWTLALLPLAAPLALYLFFSLAEYSRSWVNFYAARGDTSFFWFTFTRLAGYYVTALNNGAAYFQNAVGSSALPYYSLEWFWKFPVVKAMFPYAGFTGFEPGDRYDAFLQEKLNPELNNPSGVFMLGVDFGYLGGILAWCALGALAVFLYRLFMKGSMVGLMVYPFFYIGLLESPRILYWSDPRTLPTWLMLGIVCLAVSLVAQGAWQKRRLMWPLGRSGVPSYRGL